MPQGLVLVTGAAGGTQGQTGRHVSELLLAQGVPVRAFVHRIDERSEHLRALGADVFEGDLLDIASVRAALRDVDRVYFAYPVQDGLLDATAIMAVNAHDAGISRLVNLVMLRSSLDAPTPRMRQNYLAERIFDCAGLGALHLRATVFFENLRALVRMSLGSEDIIRLPLGSDRTIIPLISAEDVARVAVGLLTASTAPEETTYPLIGEVLDVRTVIAILGRVSGRDMQYVEISDEQWRDVALGRGLNAHAVSHLSALWQSLRSVDTSSEASRFPISDAIRRLGVASPKSFEDFVLAEHHLLTAQAAPSR
jgi:uncharacterized protein YbjT (DUF2867 family)